MSETTVLVTVSLVLFVLWAFFFFARQFVNKMKVDLIGNQQGAVMVPWMKKQAQASLDHYTSYEAKGIVIHVRNTGETQKFPSLPSSKQKLMASVGERGQELLIFPKDSKYVELAHSKLARIWEPQGQSEYELVGFPGAPPNLSQATSLGQALADIVRMKRWEFDTICTMSTIALPMAYSFMFVSGKTCCIVACDNITGNFLPENFLTADHNKRVLLLDTILQTGQHVEQAWNALEQAHHVAVGFIAAFENDMLLPGEKQRPFLEKLFTDGKAVSLTKASTIMAGSIKDASLSHVSL